MTTKRPIHHKILLLVGSVGPLGHLPASGTVTVALVGVPLYRLMSGFSHGQYAIIVLLFTIASVFLHAKGDKLLGESDSRKLVWDELVGFGWAVAFLPFSWPLAVLAFLIERSIDIVKVPPARWIDNNWHGGVGVVLDDVVAGLYTLAILHALIYLAEWAELPLL